jgi:hypothetical protein
VRYTELSSATPRIVCCPMLAGGQKDLTGDDTEIAKGSFCSLRQADHHTCAGSSEHPAKAECEAGA